MLPSADVLTYHNDNRRTGANLDETVLNPSNVNVVTFGKLGQVAVDGQVYAQPLVKTNVSIPGQGVHNVVYVVTENDSVYAFDADTLAPLWHDSFINPAAGITAVPSGDLKTTDIFPRGRHYQRSPVIDAATNTMYVVSDVKVSHASQRAHYVQQLHALDLGTGAEKLGGPTVTGATDPGHGDRAMGAASRSTPKHPEPKEPPCYRTTGWCASPGLV